MLPRSSWLDHVVTGVSFYYLTSLVVVLGVVFGHEFVERGQPARQIYDDVLGAFTNWDGVHYRSIVENGYSFDPNAKSNTAFFPLYPLLCKGLVSATRWRIDWCMVLVAHASLIGAFIVAAAYFRDRFADDTNRADLALLSLGLFPVGLFFRMAYAESTFLFLSLLAMYGMRRRWPLVVLALIIGLTTAARPVGAALFLPFALEIWRRSPTVRQFAWRAALLLPLSGWGLWAYMAYTAYTFDEPLAFAVAQYHWTNRTAPPMSEKLVDWLTLEPLWRVYDSESPCCWSNYPPRDSALFNLHFANPLYFVLCTLLTILGAAKRWLTPQEWLLCAGLILIPYFTRAHEMCFQSMGRFISLAWPIHVVVTRCLQAAPPAILASALGILSLLLGMYSALFAAYFHYN